jgi:hypothetical protein
LLDSSNKLLEIDPRNVYYLILAKFYFQCGKIQVENKMSWQNLIGLMLDSHENGFFL